MVRVKHRYLLVQILSPSPPPTSTHPSSTNKHTLLDTLTIHAPTPDAINPGTLLRLIRSNLDLLFGDHGVGAVGSSLQIKYFSNATSTFIVRCARAVVRAVWASITFIGSLPMGEARGGGGGRRGGQEREKKVVMQVVRSSGTIRKCEEEAIRRARALMGRVRGLEVVTEAGITLGVRGGAVLAGEGREDEEEAGDVVMADDDDGEESDDET